MAASRAEQPPRFVVQCAKGKGWKSLVVEEDQGLCERAFREVVKVNPRGYFRLIRLDYNPKSNFEGQEFDWKLLQLHDPKKGSAGTGGKKPGDSGARRRKPGEKVPVPIRLYGLAMVLGVALAALLYLLYGPPLKPHSPPPPSISAPGGQPGRP